MERIDKMAKQAKAQENILVQAGFLMAAGMISRVIGLLYRSPLTQVIGEAGIGYYSEAYTFYRNILMISSYSIPAAVSKVIAQKLAAREYRNAHRLFYCAMGYVLVVGFLASMLLFFGAGLFVKEEAVPVLRTFAPTIFIFGILGVLRGYFQAHKSMVQTSVSQILEQIANAVVSVVGAILIIYVNLGGLAVPDDADGKLKHAVLGAIGSAIGTGSGVVIALIFMAAMYFLNRKMILRRVARDAHENVDTYGQMIRTITMIVTPFILSTAVYNSNETVNTFLYNKVLPSVRGLNSLLQHQKLGTYSLAFTVLNIPMAFASAMATAMIPTVAQASSEGKFDEARESISTAVKSTMILAIPSAAGLLVLAKPIVYILFPRSDEVVTLAGRLLMVMSVSVIFYSLSTLSNSLLQGLGRVKVPIVNAGLALLIQTVLSAVLLLCTKIDLYGLAVTNTVYAGAMCILNQMSLRKAISYRQEWNRTFLRPLLAAAIMGLSARGLYQLLLMLFKSPRWALIPAVLFAVIVYFVLLLAFKTMTEEEMLTLPKGGAILRLARKLRLM